jgi:hypothetical protein
MVSMGGVERVKMRDNAKNLKAACVGFMLANNLIFFLIFLVVLCACAPVAQPIAKGRHYINPENEFSFKIPEGWIKIDKIPQSISDSFSAYNISKIKDVFINGTKGIIIISTDRTFMETNDYYKKLLFLSFYDSVKYKYLNAKLSGSSSNSVYEFFYDKTYENQIDQTNTMFNDPRYEIIIDVNYDPIDFKNCSGFCNVLNVKSSTYKRLKHKGFWSGGRAAYVNAPGTPVVNDLALKQVQRVFFSDCREDDTCITSITLSSDESTFEKNLADYKVIIGSLFFGPDTLKYYNKTK